MGWGASTPCAHKPHIEVEVDPQQVDLLPEHPLLWRGEVSKRIEHVLDDLEVDLSARHLHALGVRHRPPE